MNTINKLVIGNIEMVIDGDCVSIYKKGAVHTVHIDDIFSTTDTPVKVDENDELMVFELPNNYGLAMNSN